VEEKLLSKAGKEIMIKAIAQAIPVFAMGCFDIRRKYVARPDKQYDSKILVEQSRQG
jgi:hypothetical protein